MRRVAKSAAKKVVKRPSSEDTDASLPPTKKARTGKQYFLIKSEPNSRIAGGKDQKFSIDDLVDEPESTTAWDGVRNYQARNLMRDMRVGDSAFFYHSNCKVPGIVGIVDIVKEAYPDETQFDASDIHFDPKATRSAPRWDVVDVRYVRHTARLISLHELKNTPSLQGLTLITRGRLSVQPVSEDHWTAILQMETQKAPV